MNGLDANNGLGPDASHASNKPWKTIAKLLGASGMASGDTAYLSPAGPFREVVTVNMTSPVADTQIIGDPANQQGFKTSGGVLVAPGDVIWTCYTTDDVTLASATTLLTLNGRDFLTFKKILMFGGNSSGTSIVDATTTNSVNITFQDCGFIGSKANIDHIRYTGLADVASNWLIERCRFFAPAASTLIWITLPTSASADYDTNFKIQNCQFTVGGAGFCIYVIATGASSFKGGGVRADNVSIVGPQYAMLLGTANLSTSIPCAIYNSKLLASKALEAQTGGALLEDNNRIASVTPRTNVTAGGASIATAAHALMVEIGHEFVTGRQPRPFGMPMTGSPLLGRGATASGPTVDIFNITRPSGGALTSYAWGAMERHGTMRKESSIVHTGSLGGAIDGPGDQDFSIPISATSTTITVYARYDSNHAATNKPQMTVLNGEECGVSTATATMTVAADTWEQLSLNFTPTRNGIVTIRLISRSAAGNGIAYFDTFAVS